MSVFHGGAFWPVRASCASYVGILARHLDDARGCCSALQACLNKKPAIRHGLYAGAIDVGSGSKARAHDSDCRRKYNDKARKGCKPGCKVGHCLLAPFACAGVVAATVSRLWAGTRFMGVCHA